MSAETSATPVERPILFAGRLVRAILAGKKTQTRRVVRNPARLDGLMLAGEEPDWCPYGKPGDTLWVRETWQPFFKDSAIYLADAGTHRLNAPTVEAAKKAWPKWRPSIHMPRWASRITLEILSVRVERLQEISEEDAGAEGVDAPRCGRCGYTAQDCRTHCDHHLCGGRAPSSAASLFASAWDSINGKRAPWASNPWVWVVSFEMEQKEKPHAD